MAPSSSSHSMPPIPTTTINTSRRFSSLIHELNELINSPYSPNSPVRSPLHIMGISSPDKHGFFFQDDVNFPTFTARKESEIIESLSRRESRVYPTFLSNFLQNECSQDVLFLVFRHLDVKTIGRASRVCKLWHGIIKFSETSLWSHLCQSQWLRSMGKFDARDVLATSSYKSLYKNHDNVARGKYQFAYFDNTALIKGREDPDTQMLTQNVTVWPANWQSTLMCLVKDYVVWVDNSEPTFIKMLPVSQTKKKQEVTDLIAWEAHQSDVYVVLPHGECQLVSFETNLLSQPPFSIVKVWDLFNRKPNNEPTLLRSFNVPSVLSLSVNGNRIATLSYDLKIRVFNSETGALEYTYNIPSFYADSVANGKFMNLSLWEHILVYGCPDGTFYSIDIRSGAQLSVFNVLNDTSTPQESESDFITYTVALKGRHLFTNSKKQDSIRVWDVLTGGELYSLTREEAFQKRAIRCASSNTHSNAMAEESIDAMPPLESLKFAELSHDGTLLYTSIVINKKPHLCTWDFRSEKRGNRWFEKRYIRNGHGDGRRLEFWICFDELPVVKE